ncbi:MAG: glycosyltransferase [Bacteroidia bacterium]|nr:glycosyltransferase [Bacteroidia bacterium]
MEFAGWILLIACVAYAAVLIVALPGFFGPPKVVESHSAPISTAVIVAARNEAHNVKSLIDSLSKQSLMPDEIIFCDDHSEDGTSEKIKEAARTARLNITVAASSGIGKKKALSTAIAQSTSDVIIVTDADCTVAPDWVAAHVNEYANPQTNFVAGMVNSWESGGLSFASATENVFLQIVSTGLGKLRKPIMCNGANMSFRRNWFMHSGGFEGDQLASGDDIRLLTRASSEGDSIEWLGRRGIVFTRASESFRDIVLQRSRWLSKTVKMQGSLAWVAGVLLLCIQLIVPLFILQIAVFGVAETGLTIGFILKSGIEVLLLSLAVPFFKRPVLLLFYPLSVIIYPFVAVTSLVAAMIGRTEWKGRVLRNGMH